MITYVLDTSVWMALAISEHVHRSIAQSWMGSLEENSRILFCRATQQSFLRLLTNAAVFLQYGSPPLTNRAAWRTYEALLDDDRVAFQAREPDGLDQFWREYTFRPTTSPRLWMDAYLAAFARAGGFTLVTTDAAFRQFRDLDLLLLGDPAA